MARALVGLAGTALVVGGCEVDGFLEPGRLERLEKTPTSVPILERLGQIEGPANEGVDYSRILPEDLIPDVSAYRLGPGDILEIEIQDLMSGSIPDRLERDVDSRGYIDLPRLPSVNVLNRTVDQAVRAIEDAMRTARVTDNPVVSVRVAVKRQLSYNVIGGVAQPGSYAISRPDFRLLEALAQAGRFNENITYVYVVRGVPLSDRVSGRPMAPTAGNTTPAGNGGAPTSPPTSPTTPNAPTTPAQPKENIIDLIDELTKPKDGAAGGGTSGGQPSPAVFAQPVSSGAPPAAQPPTIDLPDTTATSTTPTATATATEPAPYPPVQDGPDWVFLNGQWVRAARRNLEQGPLTPMPGGGSAALAPAPNAAADLFTQRVIRVEVGPLLAGSAQHNIIVRPGDVIRVPSPSEGLVYVSGEVSRPGPYNIPSSGRLTAYRAITAAGGLSQTAVPWRAEIVRMVGPDRQAIVRIDLKAIAEGTQPDIFLKPDDQLNVGTAFWAYPLAVIRSGFRASYGFGFILDRNFGPDVFGERQYND